MYMLLNVTTLNQTFLDLRMVLERDIAFVREPQLLALRKYTLLSRRGSFGFIKSK